MKILAIDPSSNKHETSTTGVVLLDNATLVNEWVIPFGIENFKNWFDVTGKAIECDKVVIEEYTIREGERSRDNSTRDTMEFIKECYPNGVIQNNASYETDIPDDLLKALGLWEFGSSHHNDTRAAARLGLFWAMRNDVQEVVQDIGEKLQSYLSKVQE